MTIQYRLVEREGTDTLHRWPATEMCNLDDTDRDKALEITQDQAWQIVGSGSVVACKHCFPLPNELAQEIEDAG